MQEQEKIGETGKAVADREKEDVQITGKLIEIVMLKLPVTNKDREVLRLLFKDESIGKAEAQRDTVLQHLKLKCDCHSRKNEAKIAIAQSEATRRERSRSITYCLSIRKKYNKQKALRNRI